MTALFDNDRWETERKARLGRPSRYVMRVVVGSDNYGDLVDVQMFGAREQAFSAAREHSRRYTDVVLDTPDGQVVFKDGVGT